MTASSSRVVEELDRLRDEVLLGRPPSNPVLAALVNVIVANQEREWFTEKVAMANLATDVESAVWELVREAHDS